MVKAQTSSTRQPGRDQDSFLHTLEAGQHQPHRRSNPKEQLEIQMYLSKLKELVPHMPKNRKVSKLEVIQHVIDYICELQTSLEQNHSSRRRRSLSSGSTDPAALATILSSNRQPLGILSSIPNTLTEVWRARGVEIPANCLLIPGFLSFPGQPNWRQKQCWHHRSLLGSPYSVNNVHHHLVPGKNFHKGSLANNSNTNNSALFTYFD